MKNCDENFHRFAKMEINYFLPKLSNFSSDNRHVSSGRRTRQASVNVGLVVQQPQRRRLLSMR